MDGEIRVGRVSTVDYAAGSYEVIYEGRSTAVTGKVFALDGGEYAMPKVGDMVAVANLSGGNGVGLGTLYNAANRPREGRKGLWRKDLAENGEVFFQYDSVEKNFVFRVGKVTLEIDKEGNVVLSSPKSITLKGKMETTTIG